jgi:FtsZ-interacting cell division protein ZipA
LQIGILALGAAAVLGVFGYNKWQERQHRKMAERLFHGSDDDVLLERAADAAHAAAGTPAADAERREPVLAAPRDEDDEWAIHAAEEAARTAAGAAASLAPEAAAQNGQQVADAALPNGAASQPEVLATEALATEAPATSGRPAEMPQTLLSPQVDAIAALEWVEPLPAAQILASQREALRALKKPLHWVGCNAQTGAWEELKPETAGVYCRLRVGLQLANRQGPVGNGDLTLFLAAMQRLADELMAVLDLPDAQQMLDQALRLDRFCADVDMQIGVNLVSRGTPFAGTKIRALAEASGMLLTPDGVYVRPDEEGRLLFSLQNFEASGFVAESLRQLSTHGLVFLLDVPRVPRGQHAYTLMLDTARRFAEALNGQLVDDNRKPLAEAELLNIRQTYVQKPQAVMEARGIPAGGGLALRLFS